MYFEIRTAIEGYNKCKAIFDIYKKLGHLNKMPRGLELKQTHPQKFKYLGVAQGGGRGMSKLRLDRRIMVSS